MSRETTPTENVVAEWRAAMEGVTPGPWTRGRLPSYLAGDGTSVRFVYRPDDSAETRIMIKGGAGENGREFDCDADAAWIARCSPSGISGLLALIESQRATIERVERERDEADAEIVVTESVVAEERQLRFAAEARVTALEAEKAEVRAILKDLVASLNRRGQTLSISHDELSALEARAAQALSRSTEKNNG